MSEWIGLTLDVILILVVGVGIVQAMRLIAQLRDLRAGRTEMDRFVRDFNGAVMRAEAGIKSLRAAARESGDDLEKLVEKAVMVRDELHFIVESADGVAERLSVATSGVLQPEPTSASAPKLQAAKPQTAKAEPKKTSAAEPTAAKTTPSAPAPFAPPETAPSSRAEKELLQALKKLS
jgi:Domain of unknown function (DUF6468)